MAEHRADISNPQGSQGQGPSELVRGPDWSEARRATARSQRMAEREGFEPSERLRAQRFSRPPRSTTPAPLRYMRCRGLKVRRYIAKCGGRHKRCLATFPTADDEGRGGRASRPASRSRPAVGCPGRIGAAGGCPSQRPCHSDPVTATPSQRPCHKSATAPRKPHKTARASVDFASPIRIVALLRKGPEKAPPLPEALRRSPQPTATALKDRA